MQGLALAQVQDDGDFIFAWSGGGEVYTAIASCGYIIIIDGVDFLAGHD